MTKTHNVKKCKDCINWCTNSIENLKYIKDKKLQKQLKILFQTLWMNNCADFDIIWYEFAEKLEDK